MHYGDFVIWDLAGVIHKAKPRYDHENERGNSDRLML